MSDYDREIERLLKEWGSEAKRRTEKLDVKPTFLAKIKGGMGNITENEYEIIDLAVSKMREELPVHEAVATDYYISNKRQHEIATKIKMSQQTVSNYLNLVTEYVGDYINSYNRKN